MRSRAIVHSVAAMRPSLLRLTAAVGAAAAVLALTPSAFAADAVYGGQASSGEPIVLKADAKAKKLRSIIISWRAACGDGSSFSRGDALRPVAPDPGFSPGPTELLVSRNAKGTFKGTQRGTLGSATVLATVEVSVDGKLKPARASGTLAATVKVVDRATGADIAACNTGRVRWSASHKPGIIYGGSTSQGEPLVIRLTANRKGVSDVITTWHAPCATSGGSYRVPYNFSNFPVSSTGRFGDAFTEDVPMDAGGNLHAEFALAGRISRASAKGTLQVKLSETDAAGVATDNCDSGGMTWKATTG
jgi:hypothetical protein